jgi:two-component system NtrC family sensor kinase
METVSSENIDRLSNIIRSDEYTELLRGSQAGLLADLKELLENEIIPGLNLLDQIQYKNVLLESVQQDVARSRNILRGLFDNLPDLIYVIDRDYRIIAVNMALSRKIRIPPKDIVGETCYKALHKGRRPCKDCRILETFKSGHVTKRSKWETGSDRDAFEWEISSYPIYDEMGCISQVILVERDLTERHRMELMVSQSEKMAAVGQLAAGFAHEIYNPLTVVLANSQILMREIPAEDDWRDLLKRINNAGEQALETVRNLLDFARMETLDLQPTDVNSTIEKALALADHLARAENIRIVFSPHTDLPLLPASASNLQSVWFNLILNSFDAIEPETGLIEITTALENQNIVVRITDNGRGIPRERIPRIFDPFYTTKEPGRGTGLGLSICHRIVKQHGGMIEASSTENNGSVFTVRLPVFPGN